MRRKRNEELEISDCRTFDPVSDPAFAMQRYFCGGNLRRTGGGRSFSGVILLPD